MSKLTSYNSKKPSGFTGYAFVYTISFLAILAVLYPISVMLSMTFKDLDEIFLSPATWIPHRLMFENWALAFERIPILQYMGNSLKVVSGTIILTLFISTLAAYAFSKLKFYFKKFIMYMTLVLQMFSPVIVILPLFMMLRKINLIDNHMGLILLNTTFCIPFVAFLIKGFFDIIPNEVEEAAFIDGCSRLKVLTKIMIPLTLNGLAIASIFIFILTWNEFLFAYTFISTQSKEMVVVALLKILKTNPNNAIQWNVLMVAAVYVTLPVVILFTFVKKYMINSVTEGSIK